MATYVKKDYNYRVYDFKSVGQTLTKYKQDNRLEKSDIQVTPVGIKTPVQLSTNGEGLLQMHYNLGDQLKDNFRNLLLTNHGERLGFYDYGANLKELVFELGQENFDGLAIMRIKNAVEKYMPFIALGTFEPFNKKDETSQELAAVGVKIGYSIPAAQIFDQQIEVIIWSGG